MEKHNLFYICRLPICSKYINDENDYIFEENEDLKIRIVTYTIEEKNIILLQMYLMKVLIY